MWVLDIVTVVSILILCVPVSKLGMYEEELQLYPVFKRQKEICTAEACTVERISNVSARLAEVAPSTCVDLLTTYALPVAVIIRDAPQEVLVPTHPREELPIGVHDEVRHRSVRGGHCNEP